MTALRDSASHLQALLGTLDQQARAAAQAGRFRPSPRRTALVGQDSQLRYDVGDLLKELTGAARSIRVFTDYLQRNPEALLRGKGGAR